MSNGVRLAIARREQAKREALLNPPKAKVTKVTKAKASKTKITTKTTAAVDVGSLPPEVPDAPQTLDA